ncbi:MAG: hypothetical protein KDB10_10010, partial [Acidimicrobiales bacterium]|nr:hypothetical protein [Acidimicrobiales bacterium]
MRGVVVLGAAAALLLAACSSGGGERSAADDGPDTAPVDACDWPMWGQSPARTFAAPSDCPTGLSAATVGDLEEEWFFNTEDVVSATPVVVGDTVYVGDWTG